jgi:hypothetical protein
LHLTKSSVDFQSKVAGLSRPQVAIFEVRQPWSMQLRDSDVLCLCPEGYAQPGREHTERGKASLLSVCLIPFAYTAFGAAVVFVCGDKSESTAIRLLEFITSSRKPSTNTDRRPLLWPEEITGPMLDIMHLKLLLAAVLTCGIYTSMISMLFRYEATRAGLHHPSEAQIESHHKRNLKANDHSIPTDVHGRRPVVLSEADLTQKEMRLWAGSAPVAWLTTGVTLLVNVITVQYFGLSGVEGIGRDDFENRLNAVLKIWAIYLLTPFVVVPLSATLASLMIGGRAHVKELWSYTEQWGVDYQEKHRLGDLARRRSMLAAAVKGDPDANAIDTWESSEVEALFVSEKA